MSLLIKGVDMPERCRYCRFCIAEETDDDYSPYYCVNNPYLRWSTSVDIPDYVSLGCKISKIPTPHGRLIDADRLIAVLKNTTAISQSDYDLFNHIVGLIEHQPTVIEKENAQ